MDMLIALARSDNLTLFPHRFGKLHIDICNHTGDSPMQSKLFPFGKIEPRGIDARQVNPIFGTRSIGWRALQNLHMRTIDRGRRSSGRGAIC